MSMRNAILKGTAFVALILFIVLLFSCNPQKRLARRKHIYMEQVYTDVKKAINQAEVTIINDSLKVLFPSNLLFETGGAGINRETFPVMERFANILLKYSKTDILINGYTDNTGTAGINQKLSKDRADTAGAALILYKVPGQRLSFWGHGSNNPVGDNATEEGKARNRRVEFIVLYKMEE
jgi:outer membrane protein OmpA-like peptidoglycan-associated protein